MLTEKNFSKNFKKPLDKPLLMCYNKYIRLRERWQTSISKNERKLEK